MTILGKLLILFNLLAAGAFVYFATQDWKGRQTINAAVLRHRLLVDGLPPGTGTDAPTALPADPEAEIKFPVELAGGHRTDTVSKKLLEGYFQPVPGGEPLGGGPVSSQLGEVKRVKARVDALLKDAEAKPAEQLKRLAAWLRYQPETYDERQAVLALIAGGDVKGLEERLNARFAAVLGGPKPAGGGDTAAPLDETEWRDRLAHLLVHLGQEPEWQKRVAAVVGLRRYAAAVVEQAGRFRRMAERPRQSILADQAEYLAALGELQRLATDRTDLAKNQAELRQKWQEQLRKEQDFIAQRQTQLKAIEAQLARVKAEVDDLLAKQTVVEAGLFETQRELAVTLDEVYRLEERLAARERELLARPGGN